MRREQEELSGQRHELEAAQAQLHQSRRALKRAEEERDLESEDLARRRERVTELEARLTRQSEELELRREQTRNQRRRIAHELQAQRAAQQHEVESLRHKLELLQSSHQRACKEERSQVEQQRLELDSKLKQQQQEYKVLQTAMEEKNAALLSAQAELESRERHLAQARAAEDQRLAAETDRLNVESHRLRAQVDLLHSEVTRLNDELGRRGSESERLQNELEQSTAEVTHLVDELAAAREIAAQHSQPRNDAETDDAAHETERATWHAEQAAWNAEREALIDRLEEAESRLANADSQRSADVQRRFELAIEDVRALKRCKAELEEELAAYKAGASRPVVAAVDEGGDWESQKRKFLASLESEDGAPRMQPEERLTIESTVQITDEIVAQKDRDIAELRRILAQQSDNIGSISIGAAAVAQTLDQDELIQQEREKLRLLQEEWREKVRQSEIDISIERARVARLRAEIEDKVSNYETERAKNPLEGEGANLPDGTKRPVRGRWLSRLGLKDGNE